MTSALIRAATMVVTILVFTTSAMSEDHGRAAGARVNAWTEPGTHSLREMDFGGSTRRLFRVVKDHTDGVATTRSQAADAMSKVDTVDTACSLDGTVADREDHTVTVTKRHDLGSRLHLWALLGQDKLTAREVCIWSRRSSSTRVRRGVSARAPTRVHPGARRFAANRSRRLGDP